MKIVVCAARSVAEPCAQALRAALPEAQVRLRVGPGPVADAGLSAQTVRQPASPPADYALLWKPPAALFEEEPALKAVFVLGAGVDALLALPSLPPALPVIRLEDAGMAGPMADYVLAAVMRVHRRFDRFAAHQRAQRWHEEPVRPKAQFQVGVLGLGAIGGEVARVLAAQGYAVRGYARTPHTVPGVQSFAGPGAFDGFLHGLDVLVNVLPLTPETFGILNRATLARLAHGAHLINVGRGAHLVEADLLALLDAGKLAGATLDVFATEPLPPNHPFWARSEIVLTPHVSAVTEIVPAVEQIARKIVALENGAAVGGLVDRARGY